MGTQHGTAPVGQFGAPQTAPPQTAPPQYGATAHPGYGYGTPAGGTTPPNNGGTWPYAAPEPKGPAAAAGSSRSAC